jgi:hypothetical protein
MTDKNIKKHRLCIKLCGVLLLVFALYGMWFYFQCDKNSEYQEIIGDKADVIVLTANCEIFSIRNILLVPGSEILELIGYKYAMTICTGSGDVGIFVKDKPNLEGLTSH